MRRFVDVGRRAGSRPASCAACASSRSPPAGPRCARRSTAPSKFLNLVALLAALLAAVAVGIASRDFAEPPSRRLRDAARARPAAAHDRLAVPARVRRWSACWPASAGVLLGLRACTTCFVCLLAGLVRRRRCRRRASGRRCSASASGFTLLLGFGLPPVLQLAQRAAAARHPPRRRRAASRPRSAVLGGRRARLRRAAAGGLVATSSSG